MPTVIMRLSASRCRRSGGYFPSWPIRYKVGMPDHGD